MSGSNGSSVGSQYLLRRGSDVILNCLPEQVSVGSVPLPHDTKIGGMTAELVL